MNQTNDALNRRQFLHLAAAGVVTCLTRDLTAQAVSSRPTKPNIILIVADDLGYADLGCQGSADALTPHIDSIAKDGVRFTSGYVSAPVCSPARAGLITGRYQQRFGHEFNPGRPEPENFGLPLTEVTLADALKSAGYKTGMVGKWHLGAREDYRPQRRGFDEFYGFLGGFHSYIQLAANGNEAIFAGNDAIDETGYLTDNFSREAVNFISRHQNDPFFLYLAFNAIHSPMEPPPEKYMQRFPQVADARRRTMLAMLAAMDDAVGAVLARLRDLQLDQKTLIFFISDNGGPTQHNTSINAPLSGAKSEVHEGGVRVPFLMKWPGVTQTGRVYDQPVISLDIFPTVVAAASVNPQGNPPVDGVDLQPCLKSDQTPHQSLHWRYGQEQAIRHDNWKLRRSQGDDAWRLFDLKSDLAEQKDLSADHPEIVGKLQDIHQAWEQQMIPALWQGPARRPPIHATP